MIGKRLTLGLLAVALTSLVVTATTFALFTAQTSNQQNTFTAGTVTLGAPNTNMVDVTNIAPGDSGSSNYQIQYTGSLDAWIGLTTALSGGLTTCDGGNRFTSSITDGVNTYNSNQANQTVAKVTSGTTLNFTVNWALALAAGNDCQAKSAQISLMVNAVQAKNNTNPGNTGPLSWS